MEVPKLNWDLEGRPGIWDMGQEEERNFKWKRSGYCVVKYIVLFWTSELNKGLLQGGRSCAGARGAPAEKFGLRRKF